MNNADDRILEIARRVLSKATVAEATLVIKVSMIEPEPMTIIWKEAIYPDFEVVEPVTSWSLMVDPQVEYRSHLIFIRDSVQER